MADDDGAFIQRTFQRDGFFGPLNIVSKGEAEEALTQVLEELDSKQSATRFELHLILPAISKIAHHPCLVKAVQHALNSEDIWLWSSDINIKQPNSSGYYAPHQDATYAGLVPSNQCLTAWVALSNPVGETEGCLSFYAQSHKCNQLPHHTTKGCSDNLLTMGQYISKTDIERILPDQNTISIPLHAGQATLHSFDCVHASGPNKSNQARVGLALRYMTAEVVQSKSIKEMATWISGNYQNDNFDLEPNLPSQNLTLQDVEKGRLAQKESLSRWEANYFAGSSTKRTSYSQVNLQNDVLE